MIKDRKNFGVGMLLLISFFIVLGLMFTPLFNGNNFLQYADRLFNSFAKDSAYYIPEVEETAGEFKGEQVNVALAFESAAGAEKFSTLLSKAGVSTRVEDTKVEFEGDLGIISTAAVQDSNHMFNNRGSIVAEKYSYQQRDVMYHWWLGLNKIHEVLQEQGAFAQAKFVDKVITRAVEPAYNFYGVQTKSTADNSIILTAMLLFYIIYTLWFGFAIFFLFEGLGFSMEEGEKAEV